MGDHQRRPLEGYRGLAFMMLDDDIAARWHGSLKGERFRLAAPATLVDARRVVAGYNEVRLNSALGYVTPGVKLAGPEDVIFIVRDRKLEEARGRHRAINLAATCRSTTGERG